MSPRARRAPARAFVAVAAAQVASLATYGAAANPPAPTSVPDPIGSAAPKPSETPTRIKRHDGGCFAYAPSGGVAKVDCPAALDRPGDQIEREPETGECIVIESTGMEPQDTTCPAMLVPAGFVTPKPSAETVSAPLPAALAPDHEEPARTVGCARCGASPVSASLVSVAATAAALIVAGARRRRPRDR